MSSIEAILLVVVDVKDGSPTRSLAPGQVCQVSVVDTVSTFQPLGTFITHSRKWRAATAPIPLSVAPGALETES